MNHEALKEEAIADVNLRWIKTHTSELQPWVWISLSALHPINLAHRDEVELRARNNIALQANIDFMTLRQWYNLFNVAGTKEIYLKTPPGIKNSKGSSFCLELFIHEDMVSIHFLQEEIILAWSS